jgi:HEAT repeat protein
MARPLAWCYRNLLLRPWYGLLEALDKLHALLALGAGPFGARFRRPLPRYGVLCAVYAAVYLAGVYAPPAVAAAALAVGLFGVVAIGQEWARNEQKRNEIARQTRFARAEQQQEAGGPAPANKALGIPARSAYPNPDSIPDLRLFAILSAVQLLLLLPLFALVLHNWRGLFAVEAAADFGNWFRFVLDKTYFKALPDWGYLSEVHEPLINYSNPQTGDEKWAATTAWVLLYYILVQAGFREWQIQQNLADAVTAARVDPLPAILQGRRVVRRLIYRLGEAGISRAERINILYALGRLRDRRAFEPIKTIAEDNTAPEEVRAAAAIALGQSGLAGSLETLRELLKSSYPAVRKGAVIGLGEYPHPGALRFLLQKLEALRKDGHLDRDDPNVRGELALAVGRAARREADRGDRQLLKPARELILKSPSLLEDPYLRVRSRAGIALGLIGDPESVGPLTRLVETTPNPKLHVRVVPHLAAVALAAEPPARAEVVRVFLRVLKTQENDDIRIAAAGGLRQLLARNQVTPLLARDETRPTWEPLTREAAEALARALRRALRAEHSAVAKALTDALKQMGPGETNRANQISGAYNQQKSRQRVARVADPKLKDEARCRAADALGEEDGLYAEAVLRELQNNPTTPPPVKAAIANALARMTKPKTEG